jgi:small subunit ribosomal protein S20
LPTTNTAEKEMRVAERRKTRNKSVRSQTKTSIVKAEEAIAAGRIDAAKVEVKAAISIMDKEGDKGKIHPNNVARHKSRLMKKLNKAAAASKSEKKS